MRIRDFSRYTLLSFAGAALLAGCATTAGNGVSPAPGAGYAAARHKTFKYTGGEQTFTVPAGVTQIKVVAFGGNGANAGRTSGYLLNGAYGGRVSATLTVTPKEQLVIYVGGNGSKQTGGFNGGGDGGTGFTSASDDSSGGGGGGASDVRTGSGTLNDRILIAGGGAGAGGGYGLRHPPVGGKGGNLIGHKGVSSCNHVCGGAGSGGTQTAGGSGGTGQWRTLVGSNGALGIGGAGASGLTSTSDNQKGGGGGGGGGGYYGGGGGGGGGSNSVQYFDGGGGGGGSSYADGAIASHVQMRAGAKSAQRVIIIAW